MACILSLLLQEIWERDIQKCYFTGQKEKKKFLNCTFKQNVHYIPNSRWTANGKIQVHHRRVFKLLPRRFRSRILWHMRMHLLVFKRWQRIPPICELTVGVRTGEVWRMASFQQGKYVIYHFAEPHVPAQKEKVYYYHCLINWIWWYHGLH